MNLRSRLGLAARLVSDGASSAFASAGRLLIAAPIVALVAACGGAASTPAAVSSPVSAAVSAPASASVPATAPAAGSASSSTATAPASPTISGTPDTSVKAGQAYTFTPTASGPTGAALAFSISAKPAWASLNTATGQLSGTPATTDIGTFANISISVTDGTATASLAPFTITVQAGTTGTATVSWTAPSTRTDGTPLTNLAGFHIYYGNSQGSYPNSVTLANPSLSTYVVDNLPGGATYYFVATAYDAAGLESADSPPASKTIP